VIRVNDRDEIEWEQGLTVATLLERLKPTFPYIVITVDGKVVAPEDYAAHTIPDGADVRIIHIVAGG